MAAKKRKGRGKLSEVQKVFLVQRLALYESPKEAAEALKEEHGISITPQAAERYDPHKHAGRRLGKKWCELFEHTRKALLKDVEKHVPLANKPVRLRKLSKAAYAFEGSGNYVAMADMLERIAKEMGNVHTNRRELTGKEGGPIAFRDVDMMTEKEVDNELRELGVDPDNFHAAPARTQ